MSAALTSDASDVGTAPGATVVAAPERPPPALRLNVVILFMGSRGDLQPSVAIAKRLQERHGHRVRIASHPPYRAAVEAAGVDFYAVGRGCDVRAMMRRRLLPRGELRAQVPAIREEFREMGTRWWGACVGEGYEEEEDDDERGGRKEEDGFVADLVVSSMIVFNQTSAAARLGVPLHLFGMNPRIYSRDLPHSQAGWAVGGGRVRRDLSWWVQDFMFLHTIKSVFNDVRFAMGLEPMSPAWWLSQYNRLDVPCTYLWSPLLLPKPRDWADNIRVSGFVFDDVPESYAPPEALVSFLEAGDAPPVYIGFGSMTFVDAQEVFRKIFEVLREMGVRAVVCKGWSDFAWEEVGEKGVQGADGLENVLVIDEAPHAWLFPRCRAVVCHGGSGTTAMALRSGRPTLVIPVAGDQPFWGSRVAAVGCGPAPGFGIAELTVDKFRESLGELLKPEYARAAEKFADEVGRERPGEDVCVEDLLETVSVYKSWRCEVFPARPAVWSVDGRKLSALAAEVLVKEGRVRREQLRAADVMKWPDLVSPGDPITGLFFGVNRVINGLKEKAVLDVLLHIITAPLTILASVTFGMFNLVEFLLYKLASPFKPRMFASNPRVYSYGQMLSFLVSTPLVELGSLATQPGALKKKGRSTGRVVAEVPLAIVRTLIALINVLIGFVGISLRQADLACAKAMGERPRRDVVAEARFRQGRIEAERFAVERAEEGDTGSSEISPFEATAAIAKDTGKRPSSLSEQPAFFGDPALCLTFVNATAFDTATTLYTSFSRSPPEAPPTATRYGRSTLGGTQRVKERIEIESDDESDLQDGAKVAPQLTGFSVNDSIEAESVTSSQVHSDIDERTPKRRRISVSSALSWQDDNRDDLSGAFHEEPPVYDEDAEEEDEVIPDVREEFSPDVEDMSMDEDPGLPDPNPGEPAKTQPKFHQAPRFKIQEAQNPRQEGLPEAFSPQRRGPKYIAGGLAAELQSWLAEVKGWGGGDRPPDLVMNIVIDEVSPGNRMYLVKGRRIVEDEDTTEEISARLMLAGEGRLTGLGQKAPVVLGSSVAISQPAWEVKLEGTNWIVACDWAIL
ncbi:udp-transferase [Colletotrichum karsti]|uniref:Udp-transferase n=1 Tax=Colletotrichum karsti TaxID=1095194 RepID=A0A9P6IG43_9PEZI|nr:udp-transferase [Colletotrichum karsti]KAF9882244.1 udp-transferase [Colletotrichum karsti]